MQTKDSAIPVLDGSRVYLRSWLQTDLEVMHDLLSCAQTTRYLNDGATKTRIECDNLLRANAEHWLQQGCGLWALCIQGNNQIIGWSGLTCLDWLDKENWGMEISWLLKPDYWGQGLAFEAAGLIIDFGFNTMHLPHIYGVYQTNNKAAARLMTRLHFIHKQQRRHPSWHRDIDVCCLSASKRG